MHKKSLQRPEDLFIIAYAIIVNSLIIKPLISIKKYCLLCKRTKIYFIFTINVKIILGFFLLHA